MDSNQIDQVVERVLQQLRGGGASAVNSGASSASQTTPPPSASTTEQSGLFATVDEAVAASRKAFSEFSTIPLHDRSRIIEEVRRAMYPHCRRLAELAVSDTGLGRIEDKVKKNQLALDKSLGVEDVQTECDTGSRGLTMEQLVPFGVIGSITPTTNPTSTILNHLLIMPAAGNTVVFNFHPNAAVCCAETVRLMNEAFVAAGAPPNIGTASVKPTIRSAIEVMEHPDIDLLVVTGGSAVVERAMKSGKRVLAAGPGNPPVVVDETADLGLAGREIVTGASLDNNVLCICEKELFVVESVADRLVANLQKSGAYLASKIETEALEKLLITPDHHVQKDFIGKDATVILSKIGVQAPSSIQLILCEVDFEHPFVQHEMLMPVLPVVRVRDFDEAVDFAVKAEHGFHHTATIFSRDVNRITKYARAMNVSLFAANANCGATLGYLAEGCTALTIAGPTGEGVTRPRTFVKKRRVVIKDALSLL